MKNKLNKLKNKLGVIVFNIMICFCMAQNYVYAGIGSNKVFTGTNKLFTDVGNAFKGISFAVGVAVIIYYLTRMNLADEMDAKMYKKKILISFICMVGAIVVASVITTALSYYK